MRVSEFMCTDVQTVPVGTSVEEAFTMMQDGKFRHLPVIDAEGHVAGVVSDRDLRGVLVIYKGSNAGSEEYFATDDATVDEVMVANPVTVQPGTEVFDAAHLIRKLRIGCLLVTEGERLVGILSYLDLLDALMLVLADRVQSASAG